jgi:polysaccharide export outer membrane protein
MKFSRILLLFSIPVFIFSCTPTQRIPNYLENVKSDTLKNPVVIPELRIQKNDLLSIQIYSTATKQEIDQLYNLTYSTGAASGGGTGGGSIIGFLGDMNGNFEHPRLGTFHAEGLTKGELAAEIKKRLTQPVELLRDPTVIIRFLNFKVTVLGEVGKAGVVNVPGERITILEAIGLSGDFTEYGKKHTVRVAREIDGKREIGEIDLSKKELFDSPYYNLMQNDVVFVEPTKYKARQTEQAAVTQRISFALTLVTAAAFIYNIFK